MPVIFPVILAPLFAYLLGCFCTAYYLVRWRTGQDLRTLGSGTAGARNAGRVLGRAGFAIAFVGDTLKGCLALWLARGLGAGPWTQAAAMVAVVLGHLYPVQLGWRGGKGASTAFGLVLVINLWLGLLCLLVAGAAGALVRSFTRGGLIAMALAPVLGYLLGLTRPQLAGLVIVVALLLYAHRDNLRPASR